MMKIAVVTGGSSGIGFETVKELLKKGYKVYNLDLKESKNKEANTIICNITNEESIKKAIDQIEKIDVLVNCAGIFGCYYIEDTPEEFLDNIINTNIKGSFLVTKNALPKIRKTKGNIVFVSSGIGINADPTCPAYCMTESSINMLVKSLAITEIKHGIRVNAVLPGPIKTPLLLEWFKNNKELEEYAKLNPQNLIGEPKDVANAICFLADEDNKYINGSFLAVDGGESISSYLPETIKYKRKQL